MADLLRLDATAPALPAESLAMANVARRTERELDEGERGGRRLWCREEGSSDGRRAAVCVRMKSVLDSETVDGWMGNGWRMVGWNGKRTGSRGKKKD